MEEIINIKFTKIKPGIKIKKPKKPRLFLYSWIYKGGKFI